MEQFEHLVEELFVKYPNLMAEEWFLALETEVRQEITRWQEIMDSAGIA